MWEYDAWSVSNMDLRSLIIRTWERLPSDVRRSLKGVKFVQYRTQPGRYASAGERDVEIYWPWKRFTTDEGAMAVIAHELAHVYRGHYTKAASGSIAAAFAEAEADQVVRQWGFDRELASRHSWLGK
jgi:hypothetical protein